MRLVAQTSECLGAFLSFAMTREQKMPSIFLCHDSQDKDFVCKLAERLEGSGVRVWLDEAEIEVGDPLAEKIGQAIRKADYVGVVLSHDSVNSWWVKQELRMAIHKEFEEKRDVILPLLLEFVEIPPFLYGRHYADFTTPGQFEEGFLHVLRAMDVMIPSASKQAVLARASASGEAPPFANALSKLPPLKSALLDSRKKNAASRWGDLVSKQG